MIAAVSPSLDKVQQEFTSLLPQVTGRLAHRFRFNGPEAREEKIAEAVSLAWQVYQSARSRGRTVSASNLAFYAGRSVTSGRKMAGTASRDVLSSNKQRTTTRWTSVVRRTRSLSAHFTPCRQLCSSSELKRAHQPSLRDKERLLMRSIVRAVALTRDELNMLGVEVEHAIRQEGMELAALRYGAIIREEPAGQSTAPARVLSIVPPSRPAA